MRGGQKPVHLRPHGATNGRDRVWTAMRELREFTVFDLLHRTSLSARSVEDYIKGYIASGHVMKVQSIAGKSQYRLARDTGVETPRIRKNGQPVTQGYGREIMWRSMRTLKDFSIADLLAQGKVAGVLIAEREAKSYCDILARAGYLKSYDRRYQFIAVRYSGPRPPMVQRLKQLYDPNLDQVVWRQREP